MNWSYYIKHVLPSDCDIANCGIDTNKIYIFISPVPCTYTSSPLDGMDLFLSAWICKITQFFVSGSILFLPLYTRGEKKYLV